MFGVIVVSNRGRSRVVCSVPCSTTHDDRYEIRCSDIELNFVWKLEVVGLCRAASHVEKKRSTITVRLLGSCRSYDYLSGQ